MQEVLEGLEGACQRIMSTSPSKRRAKEKSLFDILTKDARRGLQIACVLRRLLHPHPLTLQALHCPPPLNCCTPVLHEKQPKHPASPS